MWVFYLQKKETTPLSTAFFAVLSPHRRGKPMYLPSFPVPQAVQFFTKPPSMKRRISIRPNIIMILTSESVVV